MSRADAPKLRAIPAAITPSAIDRIRLDAIRSRVTQAEAIAVLIRAAVLGITVHSSHIEQAAGAISYLLITGADLLDETVQSAS